MYSTVRSGLNYIKELIINRSISFSKLVSSLIVSISTSASTSALVLGYAIVILLVLPLKTSLLLLASCNSCLLSLLSSRLLKPSVIYSLIMFLYYNKLLGRS